MADIKNLPYHALSINIADVGGTDDIKGHQIIR